jgi:cellobiose phosphorylase
MGGFMFYRKGFRVQGSGSSFKVWVYGVRCSRVLGLGFEVKSLRFKPCLPSFFRSGLPQLSANGRQKIPHASAGIVASSKIQ